MVEVEMIDEVEAQDAVIDVVIDDQNLEVVEIVVIDVAQIMVQVQDVLQIVVQIQDNLKHALEDQDDRIIMIQALGVQIQEVTQEILHHQDLDAVEENKLSC